MDVLRPDEVPEPWLVSEMDPSVLLGGLLGRSFLLAAAEIAPSASLGPFSPTRPHAPLGLLGPLAPRSHPATPVLTPLLARALRGALHLVRLVGLDDVPLLSMIPPRRHHLRGSLGRKGAGAALPAWTLASCTRKKLPKPPAARGEAGSMPAPRPRRAGLEQGTLLGPALPPAGPGRAAWRPGGLGLRAPARRRAEGGLGQPVAGPGPRISGTITEHCSAPGGGRDKGSGSREGEGWHKGEKRKRLMTLSSGATCLAWPRNGTQLALNK